MFHWVRVSIRVKVNLGDDIIVGVGSTVIHNFFEKGSVLIGSPAHPTLKKEDPIGMPRPHNIEQGEHK